MARTDREKTGPGSIAETVDLLAIWARHAPWGFARVEYHSEYARAEVDRRLGDVLARELVPYHRVELPVRATPSQVWRALIERLETIESGTVSIAGLATAVAEEERRDLLAILSVRREVLAELRLCLIWWMTPDFVDLFINFAPDLASWFMVRLKIEEEFLPAAAVPSVASIRPTKPGYRIDEAMRRATDLYDRFERAKTTGCQDSQWIDLAAETAGAIVEAGAPNLTRSLAGRLVAALKESCRESWPDGLSTVRNLNRFAFLLVEHGKIAEAKPMIARATAMVGQDGPDAARDLYNLAGLHVHLEQFDRAEELTRRALAIAERIHGVGHPDFIRCHQGLTRLLWRTGRLAEAEALCRQALAIDEQRVGPSHPEVALDLYILTLLLLTANRLEEAEPLARRALEIDERCLGLEDPQVAADLDNLARLLRRMRRPAEAEPLLRRALAIDERALGPDHPVVAWDLVSLADLLGEAGRLDEAEPLLGRALAIDERIFGPDHPSTVRDRDRLESLLRDRDRLDEPDAPRPAGSDGVRPESPTGGSGPIGPA